MSEHLVEAQVEGDYGLILVKAGQELLQRPLARYFIISQVYQPQVPIMLDPLLERLEELRAQQVVVQDELLQPHRVALTTFFIV